MQFYMKFLEKEINGNYITTLDEVWIYLNDCNKKGEFTIENEEIKMPKTFS